MDYRKEFKTAHPETIGETDKGFDDMNYIEYLESQLTASRKQNAELVEALRTAKDCISKLREPHPQLGFVHQLDQIETALRSAEQQTPDGLGEPKGVYYFIENENSEWLSRIGTWTKDPMEAYKVRNKQFADNLLASRADKSGLIVSEHLFVSAEQTKGGGDE